MYQIRDTWQRLTHPRSADRDEARRERIVRIILVMTGTTCLLFTLPIVIGWGFALFTFEPVIIMLTLDLLTWGGWWLAERGYWQYSGHVPAFLLLALASYLTFINGLVTTGIVFYALAILLTTMVCSGWSPWIVWTVSIALYAGLGWLHGDRSLDLLAPVIITVSGALLGIVLLQRLATWSLQQACSEANANATELQEYREHLEELVSGRTGALRAMYQDLQKEVAQRRRAEDTLVIANKELEQRVQERTETLSRANQALQEEIAIGSQAEKEARSSSEKLRAAFEAITDGVLVADEEGRITDVNAAWLELHGFDSRDEVIGRSGFEMIFEEQRELATTRHQAAVEAGPGGTLHYTLLTRDGAQFDGEVNAAQLMDSDGKPAGLVVRVRDITESLQSEEALRRSEEQFRRIFENSPLGIYRATLEGRFLMANPAMLDMLGFDSFGDLARHNMADLLTGPAVSHQEFRQIMEREGEVVGLESEWIRRDGSTLHVRENARAIAEGGEVRYFEGTFEDITERMVAIDQLAASEVRYRSIVDLAPDGIVTMNLSGTVTSCNRMFLELTGFTREQIVGKQFTKVPTLRARDLPRWIEVFASIVRGKTPDPIEFAWSNAVGIQRWGEARISLIRKNGRIDSVLILARDITEQRRTEQMLSALNHASLQMEQALTHEEVFRSVSTELKEVGLTASIFLVDESRTHVSTRATLGWDPVCSGRPRSSWD